MWTSGCDSDKITGLIVGASVGLRACANAGWEAGRDCSDAFGKPEDRAVVGRRRARASRSWSSAVVRVLNQSRQRMSCGGRSIEHLIITSDLLIENYVQIDYGERRQTPRFQSSTPSASPLLERWADTVILSDCGAM